MMKKHQLQKTGQYTIDIAQTENDGSFLCPKCRAKISPDEENDEVYKIQGAIAEKGKISLLIECGTCGTTIKFTGVDEVVEGTITE